MSTYTPHITAERREAIQRASRAVVRLAVIPEAKTPAHQRNAVVGDVMAYTDTEAWDAVAVLEWMVSAHGLIPAEEAEAERLAGQALARAGMAQQLAAGSEAGR